MSRRVGSWRRAPCHPGPPHAPSKRTRRRWTWRGITLASRLSQRGDDVTALSHTYQYSGPSELVAVERGQALRLMTSGGGAPRPYFFEGRLLQPRLTAQALRALSRVVGTRFYIPPAMLHRILLEADPVVTCGRGMLRFEGFSSCASTYARVDLTPEAYEGDVASFGTTNVDFNAPMRAARRGWWSARCRCRCGGSRASPRCRRTCPASRPSRSCPPRRPCVSCGAFLGRAPTSVPTTWCPRGARCD